MTTIKDILIKNNKNIDTLDTELLLSYILKKPREWILAHPDETIDKIHIIKYKQLFAKRAKSVPLAYLTGHKEFFGLDFIVNKNVLIPRPETELMIELVLDKIKKLNDCKIILIDIGTGSGCIPISIANQIRKSELSVIRNVYATDISQKALLVARKNAKLHHTKIKFIHGNLLSKFPISNFQFPIKSKLPNFQIIITANLPYLTNQQFKHEPSIQHEPKLALVAGHDGLKYYKKLLMQIKSTLSTLKLYPDSKSRILDLRGRDNFITFIEIDPSQSQAIKLLIKKYLPTSKIELHKDLASLDRIVEIKIKNSV